MSPKRLLKANHHNRNVVTCAGRARGNGHEYPTEHTQNHGIQDELVRAAVYVKIIDQRIIRKEGGAGLTMRREVYVMGLEGRVKGTGGRVCEANTALAGDGDWAFSAMLLMARLTNSHLTHCPLAWGACCLVCCWVCVSVW